MQKLYFSDVPKETWEESNYFSYIIVPKRWWSIKEWKLAIKFSKEVQLYFMKVN